MSVRKGNLIIAGSGGSSGGSAMNVDNITTELNTYSEIQTIGVIEKNNSSPKYDWVGTYAEWSAGRLTGTINDSWICFITDDDKNVSSSKERTLGEIIFSLIPQNDPSLHLLDGSLIDGTGVYNAFYTYMVNLCEGGYTKCFTTEADWQTSVATYGVCGKFVLDTSNQTIRLPVVEGFIEGSLDESDIGKIAEAGLPNITGELTTASGIEYGTGSGAIQETKGSGLTHTSNASNRTNGFTFDASRSSAIYGNSDTVQPQAVKGFYYIVLSTSVNLDVPLSVGDVINDVTNLQTEVGGADYVVKYQRPTAENNYTWYRLYKSGWIEQGGVYKLTSSIYELFNLIKEMADNNYTLVAVFNDKTSENTGVYAIETGGYTTTTFYAKSTTNNENSYMCWEVKGFAASSS